MLAACVRLQILSETKDPARVQPFLRKIFEGINGLEFREDGAVTAMFSEEGEKVPFSTSFNPRDSLGAVERWLIECEVAMRDTLKVRGLAWGLWEVAQPPAAQQGAAMEYRTSRHEYGGSCCHDYRPPTC